MSNQNTTTAAVESGVAQLIERMLEQHDGTVLRLAREVGQGGDPKLVIETREAVPVPDTFEAPPALRAHTLGNAEALVEYATRYGKPDDSLVLFNDDAAVLVLNETPEKGSRERITLPWKVSQEFAEWLVSLNKPMEHRDLVKLLRRNEHTLVDLGLLAAASRITGKATVDMDSEVKETSGGLTVAVKFSGGEELVSFPKTFDISVPVFEDDALDDKLWKKASVRVQVQIPTEPQRLPTFVLVSPSLALMRRERIAHEMDKVRGGLKGWRVLRGVFGTIGRPMGAESKPVA